MRLACTACRLQIAKPEELIVNGALLTDTLDRETNRTGEGQDGTEDLATITGNRVTVGGIALARSEGQTAKVEDVVDYLLRRGDVAGVNVKQ